VIYCKYLPKRKIPLVNQEIYHVFNRGFNRKKIFLGSDDYQRGLETLAFYQYGNPPFKFSYFNQRTKSERKELIVSLKKYNKPTVETMAYCLMPNHFHLLIKQLEDNGIQNTVSKLSGSYANYFNLKKSLKGPVFEGRFKAVRIVSNEQLLHVNRYIHLNPFTNSLVKSMKELLKYPYSSIREYLEQDFPLSICKKDLIIDQFKSIKSYQEFILDQADYQKELGKIKRLLLE
jgi:putative transposase